MKLTEKLHDIHSESIRNKMRVEAYLKGGDQLITETGVIQENGQPIGQLQLVTSGEERRVQLYTADGTYLCECPFVGTDERGYEMGMALYRGYHFGWVNADLAFSRAVHSAINQKQPLEM